MLKTDSVAARKVFRESRAADDSIDAYISFIHSAYPDEEKNQYLTAEWKVVAANLGIGTLGLSKEQIIERVRAIPDYRRALRNLGKHEPAELLFEAK